MKTALVTGDLGFVGSHFATTLRSQGYRVTGFDIARDPKEDARFWLRNNNHYYDLVIHCAAVVGGRATIDGAPLDVAVDLAIDAEMFSWAARTHPGRLVYMSSSAAYPVDLQMRHSHVRLQPGHIDLDSPAMPDAVYGWIKLTGEQLSRYARQHGVDTLIVRPFSGYGEDQALDYPFPSFIERARRRADPFDVWGGGEQVRDFIHIDDIVAWVLAAVEQGYDQPLNLGWGIPTSMDDLANLVMQQVGYIAPIQHHPGAPVGVSWRVADISAASELYTPKITLAEGIKRVLEA